MLKYFIANKLYNRNVLKKKTFSLFLVGPELGERGLHILQREVVVVMGICCGVRIYTIACLAEVVNCGRWGGRWLSCHLGGGCDRIRYKSFKLVLSEGKLSRLIVELNTFEDECVAFTVKLSSLELFIEGLCLQAVALRFLSHLREPGLGFSVADSGINTECVRLARSTTASNIEVDSRFLNDWDRQLAVGT